MAKVMDACGDMHLDRYCSGFGEDLREPLQTRDDFVSCCYDQAAEVLDPHAARRLADHLERLPVVLTANHLCVETHPLFVQGNIVFALATGYDRDLEPLPGAAVPVLAFGSVSLGNQVNPRGLLLAREQSRHGAYTWAGRQLRVNVFPARLRRTVVSVAPPYSPEMVASARKQADALRRDQAVSKGEHEALTDILNTHYLSRVALEQPSYSRQASALNHRLWPRILPPDAPPLHTLEVEHIVSRLLIGDFADPGSLAAMVLFDPALRQAVLRNLNATYGCWELETLQRCLDPGLAGREREQVLGQSGTCFFWGVDGKGRHVRLSLVEEAGRPWLKGLDLDGGEHALPFEPDAVAERLYRRALLPGLFTCFMSLALARGIKCYGGFWQADYLPTMQRGLAAALTELGHDAMAGPVAATPTANYVTGLTMAVAEYDGGVVRPAGAVELVAKGGIGREELRRIRDITVEEANLFGLMEICRNFTLDEEVRAEQILALDEQRKARIVEKMVRVLL